MSEQQQLILEDNGLAQLVYGQSDTNLRALEEEIGVEVHARGNRVRIKGPELEAKLAKRVLLDLYEMARAGIEIKEENVVQALRLGLEDASVGVKSLFDGTAVRVGRRRRIIPRTPNQRRYIEMIRASDLTFGIGPAGTGKTYLAMAMAVHALHQREVGRIVLTRPAIEAGEKLGFLPGTLFDKVDPYLRPLYDALHDMMDPDEIARRMERRVIEVAPLAFMRGRTLNDAFVILDEAQNTTSEQMRMFLTRLGFDSMAVVNGDVTQIDLPRGTRSGLIEARQVLREIEGIKFVDFTDRDVVRHPLVQEIVLAYERRVEPREL
ncbi:MAG: PhoH family protein [Myxococcota bacterium]|nr:PhoH family protein [Myxococcota bacterium]